MSGPLQFVFIVGCLLVLLGTRTPVVGWIGLALMVVCGLGLAWLWSGKRRTL